MGLRLGAGLLLFACIGCGLDEGGVGVQVDDGGAPLLDAQGSEAALDDAAPSDAALDVANPVEAGSCDDDANDCQSPEVPTGWAPAAYVENPSAACPAPFAAQDDVVTNVGNGTASCSCTCSKIADPSCTTGTVTTSYGDSSLCNQQGSSLSFANGGCVTINGNLHGVYASSAIAPVGGSCSVQTTSAGAIAMTNARLCMPSPSCRAAACGGYAPAGFSACIVADGDQACPSGSSFSTKHAIAATAAASCTPTCGTSCSLTATCATPQVHLFSDGSCKTSLVTLPSDGTCAATGGGGSVGSATYSATPNVTGCATPGMTSLQIDRTTPRTVCCR